MKGENLIKHLSSMKMEEIKITSCFEEKIRSMSADINRKDIQTIEDFFKEFRKSLKKDLSRRNPILNHLPKTVEDMKKIIISTNNAYRVENYLNNNRLDKDYSRMLKL